MKKLIFPFLIFLYAFPSCLHGETVSPVTFREGNKGGPSSGATVNGEKYELIVPAANGFMIMKKNGMWGYLNSGGEVIAPALYEGVKNIKGDGTALIKKRGMWGVMNGRGKIIVAVQYEDAGNGEGAVYEMMQAAENFFRVKSGGKWGLISLTGEVKVPLKYSFIGGGKSGYFPALRAVPGRDGKSKPGLTLLDKNGWELFEPDPEYNTAGEDGEGLLAAGIISSRGGKLMGYINHHGETVITPEYREAGAFKGGFAIVNRNGLYGVINRKGMMVEDAVYDDIKRSAVYPGLYEGVLNCKKIYFDPGGKHFRKEIVEKGNQK
ncbi:MAG TPA: WG repeat-containing protein [Spirochaetota bacterium]|nr:WG repeat-containing protein [Spirochaetota bacterium]HPJ33361.1 WG repeat-containing protein [Spirochaetota bacterium]